MSCAVSSGGNVTHPALQLPRAFVFSWLSLGGPNDPTGEPAPKILERGKNAAERGALQHNTTNQFEKGRTVMKAVMKAESSLLQVIVRYGNGADLKKRFPKTEVPLDTANHGHSKKKLYLRRRRSFG